MTMLNYLINKYGLEKLNTLTKYPSILTYHALNKGSIIEEFTEDPIPENTMLQATEKVDGTNGRLICIGDDFLIGERERLVYAKGDRIILSEIVPTMLDKLSTVIGNPEADDFMTVIFGEVYGYKIQDGSKVYIANGDTTRNFRVFDVYSIYINEIEKILSQDIQAISTWKEHNHQPWYNTQNLQQFVDEFELERTPIVAEFNSDDLPKHPFNTLEFMEQFKVSKSTMASEGKETNQKFARAEGIVIRTADRKFIKKLRFEDYEKGRRKGWK